MEERSTVAALHISPAHFQEMRSMDSAEVIQDLGVAGDRYAQKRGTNRSRRQVLLMDQETLEALGLTPGTVRENITTRGLALYTLRTGQRLGIGSQVVLEVTEPCEPCQRMDAIRQGLQEQLQGHRGMLTRVVQGGKISVGDAIKVLNVVAN